jgi:hypothetical protein
MKRSLCSAALLAVLAWSPLAEAQTPQPLAPPGSVATTVTVTEDAPIFLEPGTARDALRVAKQGSVLRLLDRAVADWCHIEFQDPQYGRRVGYIEAKFVRSRALDPTDVSITDPAGQIQPPGQIPPPAVAVIERARSSGFLIGTSLDETYVSAADIDGWTDGLDVIVGYGFNRTVSLYGNISVAGTRRSKLAHVDIGVRAHLVRRPGPRAFPFVQVAATGLGLSDGLITTSGGGVSVGAGGAFYPTPAVGVTIALMTTAGSFVDYEVNGRQLPGYSLRVTTLRLQFGIIAFPQHRK